MRLTKKYRRSHLQRRAVRVENSGLCTWNEAFCALAETGGDEQQAIAQCRNENYRSELKLAAEVLEESILKWLKQPRINRHLLNK